MNGIENNVRVFHESADCPGIIVGPLNDLHCAECGETDLRAEMPQIDKALRGVA